MGLKEERLDGSGICFSILYECPGEFRRGGIRRPERFDSGLHTVPDKRDREMD